MPSIAPTTAAGLAERMGVDVDTIQKYETMGLLPGPRLRSGRRTSTPYGQEHVDRLRFIRRCQDFGFSLDAIADLLAVNGGMRTCGDVHAIAARQLDEIRGRIARLRQIEEQLAPLVETCPRQGSLKESPIWQILQSPAETV